MAEKKRALFASGCFWGTQYFFSRKTGVLSVEAGYIGGHVESPTYEQVCSGQTGHAEAVEVLYDAALTDFESLARLFFETHDPTQVDRQGPDIGTQYRSEIFYLDEEQKETSNRLIRILEGQGLSVATRVTSAGTFWKAEDNHQEYFDKRGSSPYCHVYTKRFKED